MFVIDVPPPTPPAIIIPAPPALIRPGEPGFVTPEVAGVIAMVGKKKAGGNDEFAKFLAHCDGTDASTSFPDASATGHTATANGNAQVDTSQSKHGGASMLLDGTSGTTVTVPAHADFKFGTGPFTIDYQFRQNATANNDHYFALGNGSSAYNALSLQFESATAVRVYDNDASLKEFTVGDISSGWHHIACVRDGANLTIYVDGNASSSGVLDVTGADFFSAGNPSLEIGRTPYIGGHSGNYVDGWIDEFRLSNVARWTADFTPPAAAYS